MFPRERFPVLPIIFMDCPHTYDGNKDQTPCHDANPIRII